MIKILKLSPVNIGGCAVGVRAEDGTPIMKPWRILVSSEHVGKALEGHLCDRSHAHARCEGSRTSRTAIYPKRLCELIHEGLDARACCRPWRCGPEGLRAPPWRRACGNIVF